jgi:hypothetical protein
MFGEVGCKDWPAVAAAGSAATLLLVPSEPSMVLLHDLILSDDAVQDFGARDPTPGEIGSNFGEKIVMNWDTEHIIK